MVQKGYDRVKKKAFYRPLGGRIKFGEFSFDTVKRELLEEINAEVKNLQYIGTLENIFTYNGLQGHELVQVFKADLKNLELFKQPAINGFESDGEPIEAFWIPIDYFTKNTSKNKSKHNIPIYPEGILKLITNSL